MFARLRGCLRNRWVAIAFAGCILALTAIAWNMYQEAWRDTENLACGGSLSSIGEAILLYEARHGRLPPAHIDAPNGLRMHSWRALIVADQDNQLFSFPYDVNEPWNSPNNSKLGVRPQGLTLACPSDPETQRRERLTNYFVIEGADTPFPGSVAGKLSHSQESQCRGHIILMAEATGLGIEWLEPRDLVYDKMSFTINDSEQRGISGHHPQGPNVCMADGSVRSLGKGISPEVLRAMLQCPAGTTPDNRSE